MTPTITNAADVIDSRDIIERLEELEALHTSSNGYFKETDDLAEYLALSKLAEQCADAPDWKYGETLIRRSYWVKYIEQLIDDCYEMPKELKSGDWPWRHVKVDYKAAADEAEVDYISVYFDGVEYLIRSV